MVFLMAGLSELVLFEHRICKSNKTDDRPQLKSSLVLGVLAMAEGSGCEFCEYQFGLQCTSILTWQ